ncbi:hypothetical protein K4H28_16285 [Deefgea tanakiae]|jgi:tetratricopeptide (TPR) repeat protein|uniref:Tetratricopeptide repeat protein n=1 Tax=Deefgea tanakiae TaxID=2865840 RepID=A0ABX8Z5H0_9NEIS|nr:hypothetical protein [Deefgea tanakiae]QZA77801.1 hypothetical protein K4H28_16285 [Deefgea tanakiae]
MGTYNLRTEIEETLNIARSLIHTDPDEALRLARFVTDRAASIEDRNSQALAALIIALAFRAIPSAKEDEREAAAATASLLALQNDLDDAWIDAIDCHADVSYDTGNYNEAMDLWLQLLEVGLERRWPKAIARAYIGVGKLFFIYEDPQSSLEAHLKVTPLLSEIADKNIHVCHYLNVAAAQLHLHNELASNQALDLAESALIELAFCEYEPELYYYRGHLLRNAGQKEAAKQQFERAFALNGRSSNYWGKVVNMIAIGELHLAQNETHSSHYFMQQALDAAASIPAKYLLMLAHAGLAQTYAAKGQTDLEFTHWQQHFEIAEEINTGKTSQRLATFKRHSLQQRVHELEDSLNN